MLAPPPLGSLETPTGLPARMPGALTVVIFLTLALTGSMEPRGVEATTPSMLAAPAASALEALAPVGEVVAGTVADVVARGTTAYAAVGERLVVLDVADDGPRVLGVMPAEADDVMAVAVAGTRAYLAAGTAGLRVVDVADPARPMSLGRWPGEAHAVALAGATAFVLGDGLHVLDVSGPTPREVASLEAGGLALAVAGDVLAVAAGAEGVRFYDVATRGRPVLISTFPTPKGALDVALGDGRALVAAGLGGLRLLDISDSRRPEEVGFFEMQVSGGCAPGSCTASATRVVLDGSRALVTWARCEAAFSCRFAPRVTVMDVLDPSAPTVAATLELEGNPVAVATAAGGILVAVRPLWWYQGIAPCRLAPGGLLLLDQVLQPRGQYEPASAFLAVAASGSHVALADATVDLRVYDVADPAEAREVESPWSLDVFGAWFGSPEMRDVAIAGDRVVLVRGPQRSGFLASDTARTRWAPRPPRAGAENRVGAHARGSEVPGPGRPLNGCAPPPRDEWYTAVDAWDQDSYLVDLTGTVQVWRGGTRGDFHAEEAAQAVAGSDGRLLVATASRLYLVDVRDVASPREVTSIQGGAQAVAVAGDYAYLAAGNDGVGVVRLGTSSVEAVARIRTGRRVVDVAVAGGRVFVADGGLAVYDVRQPAAPQFVGRYDDVSGAWGVAATFDRAFVLAEGGLYILALPPLVAPTVTPTASMTATATAATATRTAVTIPGPVFEALLPALVR